MSFEAPRNLRKRLCRGETVVGGWQTLAQPAIAEVMVMSGIDWLLIDMEHSMLDFRDVSESIRVADLLECPVLVRPPDHDPATIKRLLDAKAHGIMAANVRTASEARAIVAATRYPPGGIRGVGLARAQAYGNDFEGQFSWSKEGPLVIVQIEDIVAIENITEIFAVDGIDAFFVGPYDLSCSLGAPGDFECSDFIEAMGCISEAGRVAGLPAGFHQVEPDPAALQERIKEGYNFIAYGVDFRILYRGMADAITSISSTKRNEINQ